MFAYSEIKCYFCDLICGNCYETLRFVSCSHANTLIITGGGHIRTIFVICLLKQLSS